MRFIPAVEYWFRIDGPVFVMKNGEKTYSPMDQEYLEKINNAEAGY